MTTPATATPTKPTLCDTCEVPYDAEYIEIVALFGPFICPQCEREGCPECMPAGRGCMCPECEEGAEGS
jgi:hypothetical protein